MTQLGEAADDVFASHAAVLEGLVTGVLVPEQPSDRRPRITSGRVRRRSARSCRWRAAARAAKAAAVPPAPDTSAAWPS